MQVGWFLIVAFFIGCFVVYLIAKPDEIFFLYPKNITTTNNETYEYINQIKKKAEIISRQNIQKYKENNREGIYKIKVWYNASETWRDSDDICVSLEKYFSKIDSALDFMTNYVEQNFSNAGCFHIKVNTLICSDYCSWGKTIELKRIEAIK